MEGTAERKSPHEIIAPLCAETARLIQPIKTLPNEWLRIGLVQEGRAFDVQVYAKRTDGTMGPASYSSCERWFLRMPERRKTGFGRWTLKATDFNVVVMAGAWPRDRLEFEDDDAKTVFQYLLARFVSQSKNARKMADFKLNKTMPPMPDMFLDHPQRPLKPHQRVAAWCSFDQEGFGLFMQQSTGKTPTVIARICSEARRKKMMMEEGATGKSGLMYRAVIVAPKNVRENWKREIERFATTPGKVVVLRGGKVKRMKQLVECMMPEDEAEWGVVILNYDTVSSTWDALSMIPWDLAVCDESHKIKSPSARRTKKLMELRDIAGQRMCLTGTPFGNSIGDLYHQLEFLGEGMSGFSSYKNFRNYYIKYTKDPNPQDRRVMGYQNLPILQERLARSTFQITKQEVDPDMPEKVYDIIEVQMSKEQHEYYIRLQKDLAIEIEGDLANTKNAELTATNILTKLLRLNQITAGYIVADKQYSSEGDLLNDDERISFFEPNPKMDELINTIKEKGDKDKTIVWTCWVPTIHEISKRLTQEGIKHVKYFGGTNDRDRLFAEDTFNQDPKVKVFIGNPAAGGVGMNLPGYVPDWEGTEKDHGCNANHAIFYACNWSFIDRSQAEDRNHGQFRCRENVRISDMCVPSTIDEQIRAAVVSKKITAVTIQDARQVMASILKYVPEDGD